MAFRLRSRLAISACSMLVSSSRTSVSALSKTMFPLASTDATFANPSRSNTPRSCSLDWFLPLGAIPRSSAAY